MTHRNSGSGGIDAGDVDDVEGPVDVRVRPELAQLGDAVAVHRERSHLHAPHNLRMQQTFSGTGYSWPALVAPSIKRESSWRCTCHQLHAPHNLRMQKALSDNGCSGPALVGPGINSKSSWRCTCRQRGGHGGWLPVNLRFVHHCNSEYLLSIRHTWNGTHKHGRSHAGHTI